jgi:hypothetical protein
LELHAPYWNISAGLESTLVINNTTGRSIEVTPQAFAANGALLPANPITVPGNSSIDVPVQNLLGINNGSGQISLTYQGLPLEINALMVVVDRGQSHSFSHPLAAKSDFSGSQLERCLLRASTIGTG